MKTKLSGSLFSSHRMEHETYNSNRNIQWKLLKQLSCFRQIKINIFVFLTLLCQLLGTLQWFSTEHRPLTCFPLATYLWSHFPGAVSSLVSISQLPANFPSFISAWSLWTPLFSGTRVKNIDGEGNFCGVREWLVTTHRDKK